MASADPDFSLLRGAVASEDSLSAVHLAPETTRRARRPVTPRSRRRFDGLSRFVRVVLPALVIGLAAEATGVDGVLGWAMVAAVAATLLAKTARARQLDVGNELRHVRRVSAALTIVLMTLVCLEVVGLDLGRAIFVSSAAGVATLVVLSLALGLAVPPRRILLVGDRKATQDLIRQWDHHPSVQICGVCLDDASLAESASAVDESPVMGSMNDVPLIVARHAIDQVVVAPGPQVSAYDVRRLTWGLEHSNAGLAVAAEVHGATPRRVAPELIGRRLVLAVGTPHPSATHRVVKATIDRALGAALLVLFAPALLAVMVWVRMDSHGPAIFRQERTGLGGRSFTMYKFRTMHVGAEDQLDELRAHDIGAGLLFKLPDDPRVTRLGRRLRRSSLDELPQLLNVVKGDMSLIGPRPGLPSETREYDEWIARRLRVRPGMTGLWQVSGRSNLGWHESVRLDLDYVDNQTLRDEFAIAYKTVRAVLQRDGAM